MNHTEVLCCGLLVADFAFSLKEFPKGDDKVFAESFNLTSGGPAANAALTVRLLGGSSQLIATTDNSLLGTVLNRQLSDDGFDTSLLMTHDKGLNTAAILSKTDGQRQVVSCKGTYLPESSPETITKIKPKVILFDGHQPKLSIALLKVFPGIPSILDAGSVHEGTDLLKDKVDWLIGSAKFARKSTGLHDIQAAVEALSKINNKVIITDGDKGCHWIINGKSGHTPAFSVNAIDSNGAGDVFHGAFAYGLAQRIEFEENILFASKAAALSCTGTGLRKNIPRAADILNY